MGSNEDKTNQDIIRDLKQQRDQLDLAVIDYKRQKEEYQKTQTILNQTQRDKEEKYLNDIIQLQAKNKDLENVVCKMGKSTETLWLLANEQKAFRDNLRKSGLGTLYTQGKVGTTCRWNIMFKWQKLVTLLR
ncbi:hypothetical protein Tco_1252041 [Tanacetum coccineum]